MSVVFSLMFHKGLRYVYVFLDSAPSHTSQQKAIFEVEDYCLVTPIPLLSSSPLRLFPFSEAKKRSNLIVVISPEKP